MNYFDVLNKSVLFSGMSYEDIEAVLGCARARLVNYEKNEIVVMEGGIVTDIGIVLSGHARSFKTDASGKSFIIYALEEGSFIGVLLAASRERKSPVTVQAVDALSVMFIPFAGIIGRCTKACPRHEILLRNCFIGIAEKSLLLYDRIDCLMRPTVREKILAYLTRLANELGSRLVTIPFDRSAMAEYLNVERSALSRELSRMKRDGIIDYHKNSFKLIYTPVK